MIRFAVLLACCGLAACGANSYCLVQQDYQKAEIVPELRAADGLEMPDSPSALRLPAAPANPAPFGVRNKDGEGVCLDKPPRMPASPAAAPAKPAAS